MPTGTVKFYNRKKGFGFIKIDESDREIFVHATGIIDKRNLQENDRVSFDEGTSDRGPAAVNVKKI